MIRCTPLPRSANRHFLTPARGYDSTMMRQVVLYQDEDGNWIAEVPSLPGCRSDGDTRDEAIENAKDAITVVLEYLHETGQPIPKEHGDITVERVAVSEDEAA